MAGGHLHRGLPGLHSSWGGMSGSVRVGCQGPGWGSGSVPPLFDSSHLPHARMRCHSLQSPCGQEILASACKPCTNPFPTCASVSPSGTPSIRGSFCFRDSHCPGEQISQTPYFSSNPLCSRTSPEPLALSTPPDPPDSLRTRQTPARRWRRLRRLCPQEPRAAGWARGCGCFSCGAERPLSNQPRRQLGTGMGPRWQQHGASQMCHRWVTRKGKAPKPAPIPAHSLTPGCPQPAPPT